MSVSRSSQPVIFVQNIHLPANIGVFDHEKSAPQHVRVSFRLFLDPHLDFSSDILDDTVCYKTISENIKSIMIAQHHELVEVLCDKIGRICCQDTRVRKAWVRVEKMNLPTMPYAECVGTECEFTRD